MQAGGSIADGSGGVGSGGVGSGDVGSVGSGGGDGLSSGGGVGRAADKRLKGEGDCRRCGRGWAACLEFLAEGEGHWTRSATLACLGRPDPSRYLTNKQGSNQAHSCPA